MSRRPTRPSAATPWPGRVGAAVLGALDVQAIYLGDRLGLYRALAEGGPATAPELATRTGIDPRYAREWLEQQAVGRHPRRRGRGRGRRRAALLVAGRPRGGPLDADEPVRTWRRSSRFVVGSAQRMPDSSPPIRTGSGVDWARLRPRRHRGPGGASTGRSSAPRRRLDRRRCRTSPRACATARAGRGRRLWHGLVVDLDRPALPRDPGRRHRHRRGLDRTGEAPCRRRGADRPRLVPVRRCRRQPRAPAAMTS